MSYPTSENWAVTGRPVNGGDIHEAYWGNTQNLTKADPQITGAQPPEDPGFIDYAKGAWQSQIAGTWNSGISAMAEFFGKPEAANYFWEKYKENERKALELRGVPPTLQRAEDLGDYLEWAQYALATGLTSFAEMAIEGGLGAAVGGMAAGPAGAVAGGAGGLGRSIARKVGRNLAREVVQDAGSKAARKAAQKQLAKRTGATVGILAPSVIRGTGEVWSEQVEETNAPLSPETAITFGTAIGSIDAMMARLGFGMFSDKIGSKIKSRAFQEFRKRGGYGKKIAGGAALEGGTEAIQESIAIAARDTIDEEWSVMDPMDRAEALWRLVEAGAVGALTGGALGGAARAWQGKPETEQDTSVEGEGDPNVPQTGTVTNGDGTTTEAPLITPPPADKPATFEDQLKLHLAQIVGDDVSLQELQDLILKSGEDFTVNRGRLEPKSDKARETLEMIGQFRELGFWAETTTDAPSIVTSWDQNRTLTKQDKEALKGLDKENQRLYLWNKALATEGDGVLEFGVISQAPPPGPPRPQSTLRDQYNRLMLLQDMRKEAAKALEVAAENTAPQVQVRLGEKQQMVSPAQAQTLVDRLDGEIVRIGKMFDPNFTGLQESTLTRKGTETLGGQGEPDVKSTYKIAGLEIDTTRLGKGEDVRLRNLWIEQQTHGLTKKADLTRLFNLLAKGAGLDPTDGAKELAEALGYSLVTGTKRPAKGGSKKKPGVPPKQGQPTEPTEPNTPNPPEGNPPVTEDPISVAEYQATLDAQLTDWFVYEGISEVKLKEGEREILQEALSGQATDSTKEAAWQILRGKNVRVTTRMDMIPDFLPPLTEGNYSKLTLNSVKSDLTTALGYEALVEARMLDPDTELTPFSQTWKGMAAGLARSKQRAGQVLDAMAVDFGNLLTGKTPITNKWLWEETVEGKFRTRVFNSLWSQEGRNFKMDAGFAPGETVTLGQSRAAAFGAIKRVVDDVLVSPLSRQGMAAIQNAIKLAVPVRDAYLLEEAKTIQPEDVSGYVMQRRRELRENREKVFGLLRQRANWLENRFQFSPQYSAEQTARMREVLEAYNPPGAVLVSHPKDADGDGWSMLEQGTVSGESMHASMYEESRRLAKHSRERGDRASGSAMPYGATVTRMGVNEGTFSGIIMKPNTFRANGPSMRKRFFNPRGVTTKHIKAGRDLKDLKTFSHEIAHVLQYSTWMDMDPKLMNEFKEEHEANVRAAQSGALPLAAFLQNFTGVKLLGHADVGFDADMARAFQQKGYHQHGDVPALMPPFPQSPGIFQVTTTAGELTQGGNLAWFTKWAESHSQHFASAMMDPNTWVGRRIQNTIDNITHFAQEETKRLRDVWQAAKKPMKSFNRWMEAYGKYAEERERALLDPIQIGEWIVTPTGQTVKVQSLGDGGLAVTDANGAEAVRAALLKAAAETRTRIVMDKEARKQSEIKGRELPDGSIYLDQRAREELGYTGVSADRTGLDLQMDAHIHRANNPPSLNDPNDYGSSEIDSELFSQQRKLWRASGPINTILKMMTPLQIERTWHHPKVQQHLGLIKNFVRAKQELLGKADSTIKEWKRLPKAEQVAVGEYQFELTDVSNKIKRRLTPLERRLLLKRKLKREVTEEDPAWKAAERIRSYFIDTNRRVERARYANIITKAGKLSAEQINTLLNDPRVLYDPTLTPDENRKQFYEWFKTLDVSDWGDTAALDLTRARKMAVQLQQKEYFPFMRFGAYNVAVFNTKGELSHLEFVDNKDQQAALVKHLREKGMVKSTDQIVLSQKEEQTQDYGPFPFTVFERIGESLNLSGAQKVAFKNALLKNLPGESYMKRMIQRKGTAGFSREAMQTFAKFANSAGGHVARAEWDVPLQSSLDGMNPRYDKGGFLEITRDGVIDKNLSASLHNYFARHYKYLFNPQNDGAFLRNLGYTWFLGWNVKSAFVNLTQPFTTTLPYLTERYGAAQASRKLAEATALASRALDFQNKFISRKGWSEFEEGSVEMAGLSSKEKMISRALNWARSEGFLTESFAAEIGAAATESRLPSWYKQAGDTDLMSKGLLSRGKRSLRESYGWYSEKGSWMFHKAEVFNRHVAFIAAYEAARAEHPNAGEVVHRTLAREAVEASMFEYASWNRPEFMRGVFAPAWLFKMYIQHAMALGMGNSNVKAGREVVPGNPFRESRKSLRTSAGFWAIHLAMAGAMGLPGAETLEELATWLMREYGGDPQFDLKEQMRDYSEYVGLNPDIAMKGLSSQYGLGPLHLAGLMGAPVPNVDLSGSLSLSNILPGTGFAVDHNANWMMNFLVQLGGPIPAIPVQMWNGLTEPDTHKSTTTLPIPGIRSAIETGVEYRGMLPPAIKNVFAGTQIAERGGLPDKRNSAINSVNVGPGDDDITWAALAAKYLSFQPSIISKKYEEKGTFYDLKDYWMGRRGRIMDAYDWARSTNDKVLMREAIEAIKEFNKDVRRSTYTRPLSITRDGLKRSARTRDARRAKEAQGLPNERMLEGLMKRAVGD